MVGSGGNKARLGGANSGLALLDIGDAAGFQRAQVVFFAFTVDGATTVAA